MQIEIKRVYDDPDADDGYRVLIDRLWPRGVAKATLVHDEWDKEIAPSSELRKWFHHDVKKFLDFKRRYLDELRKSEEPAALIQRAGRHDTLTLLYAAKDLENNQAVVLRDFLRELRRA